jgi:hypothetical protein
MRDISGGIARGIDAMGDRATAIEPGVVDIDCGVAAVGVDVRCTVMNCHIDMLQMNCGSVGLRELVLSIRVERWCTATHNIDSCVEAIEAGKKEIRSIARLDDLDVLKGQFGIVGGNNDTGVVGCSRIYSMF